MPLILFIRHAENDYVKKGLLAGRLPDVHRNENGHAQAQALADHLAPRLKKARINTIYSSPLERALEPSSPLAKALGIDTTLREGLLELQFISLFRDDVRVPPHFLIRLREKLGKSRECVFLRI